jgi:hypothetical protein
MDFGVIFMALDFGSLLGEDSSFSNLSGVERGILQQVLMMEMDRRKGSSKAKLIREIAPIEKWLDSEYFMGPNGVYLYDYWKDLMRIVFDSRRTDDSKINQIILSGSIGIGKSTVANMIMLRKIYELSCYQNVTALFNLMRTSNIVFLYFSVNKYQAEMTGFGDMIALLDSIPYFKDSFPRNDKIDSLILLPENMMMTYGSGSQHAIGLNILGSILDEANFFGGEAKKNDVGGNMKGSKVAGLYSSIVNRSKSRFVVDGGVDHSLNILVSSATHESSFTEQRIQASRDDPHTIVRCPTLWEVKPKAYSGRKFYVFKGNDALDPFVISSIDDVNQYRLSEGMSKCANIETSTDLAIIDEEIKKLPANSVEDFLGVPIELKKGFESNLIQSLQDIGGVSVSPTGRLFTSKPVYNKNCFDYMVHPFVSESIVISTGDNIKIQDYIRRGHKFKDLNRPRYIHIDQSAVTDSTGISSVYIDDFIEEDGVKKPIFGVDFMIQIVPPKPPKRLAIYKIRDFIVHLNKVMGFKFGKVSYDIFNSEESRQILTEMGYNIGYVSVDRTDKAYVDFVTLLYEERMRMYDYEPAKKELFSLIHDRKIRKVDHPKKNGDGTTGSKDVTDSLVGAVQNALMSSFSDNEVVGGIGDFMNANPMAGQFFGYDAEGNKSMNVKSGMTISDLIDKQIDTMLDELDFMM